MRNSFRYGQIVKGENFYNRENEITEIHKAIKNGYSFWMYSPRRYGKTSLILRAFETMEDYPIAKELFNWKAGIKILSKKIGV
jgi:hypothetical protein